MKRTPPLELGPYIGYLIQENSLVVYLEDGTASHPGANFARKLRNTIARQHAPTREHCLRLSFPPTGN
jgi:hypothetical protein